MKHLFHHLDKAISQRDARKEKAGAVGSGISRGGHKPRRWVAVAVAVALAAAAVVVIVGEKNHFYESDIYM